MFCKVCNTRMGEGERVCPNCGKVAAAPPQRPRTSPEAVPGPVEAEVPLDETDELEVSLEEALQEVRSEPLAEAPSPGPRPAPEAPARRVAPPAKGAPPPPRPREAPASGRAPRPEPETGPLLGLEPEGLRDLVAGEPGLVEPGLRSLGDGDGHPVGAAYATPVGAIDLLARDARGTLVVVQVAERGAGAAALSDALQRVGWVRKHLAQPGQGVRAVVLVESPSPDLGYAAAAVAETVAFKSWRVRLEVEDAVL